MKDVRSGREIEPGAAGFERQNKDGSAVFGLKIGDERVALRRRQPAVKERHSFQIEHVAQDGNEKIAHFFELGENERAFVIFDNRFEHIGEPQNFSRTIGGLGRRFLKQRRMVDDLFEMREQREHMTVAGDAVGAFDLFHRGVYERLIERGLFPRQRAKDFVFHFFGEIPNDLRVGFDAAQDERRNDVSQPFFGFFVVVSLDRDAVKALESRMRSQQPRIEKIEDRP